MQKLLLIIYLTSIPLFAADLKTQCSQEADKNQWIYSQIETMGLEKAKLSKNPISVEFNAREEALVVWVPPNNCEAITHALITLSKIKKQNVELKGVRFVFTEDFKVNKVVLKDFVLPLKVSTNTFLKNLTHLDANPVEALEISKLFDDYKKLNPNLKKLIEENEIQKAKEKLTQIKDKAKTWSLKQALDFKESWGKHKPILDFNSDVKDHEALVLSFDKLRRGLWEDGLKEFEKVAGKNEKLKEEVNKGRENLDNILKHFKSEILKFEAQVQKTFKEKHQVLFSNESS